MPPTHNDRRVHMATRRTLVLAAAGLALLTAPFAIAGAGMRGMHHGPPATAEEAVERATTAVDFMLYRLDATPEQRAAIEAIVEDAVPGIHGLHEEGDDLRERFHEALKSGSSRAELEKLRLEGLELVDEGSALALDNLVLARDVLTPEQRAELEQLHDEHGPRHHMGGPGHE